MKPNLNQSELKESRVRQQLYFTLKSVEDTLDELIQYTDLIWGNNWTPENLAAYEVVAALNKFLQQHPEPSELFEMAK